MATPGSCLVRFLRLLLPVLLASCASVGNNFNYAAVASLQLGGLSASDYRARFGPPQAVQTSSSSDGSFVIARYLYASGNLATTAARALFLEFRNGTLNAWIYVSGFDEDKTTADLAAADTIARERSTKSDAQSVLGAPHGRALCPSTLVDYKDRCSAAEVWSWAASPKTTTLGRSAQENSTIFVHFDAAGHVAQVEKIQNTAAR